MRIFWCSQDASLIFDDFVHLGNVKGLEYEFGVKLSEDTLIKDNMLVISS